MNILKRISALESPPDGLEVRLQTAGTAARLTPPVPAGRARASGVSPCLTALVFRGERGVWCAAEGGVRVSATSSLETIFKFVTQALNCYIPKDDGRKYGYRIKTW